MILGVGDHPNLLLDEFKITRKIKHPLIRKKIIKPSIHLYQPIMISNDINYAFTQADLYYLKKHTIPKSIPTKGILFSQKEHEVIPLYDQDIPIEFESIKGFESKSMNYIIAQTYEFQSYILENSKVSNSDLSRYKEIMKHRKYVMKENKNKIISFRNK